MCFSLRLEMLKVGAALSSFVSEFHAAGPAYENARSPNFVRIDAA